MTTAPPSTLSLPCPVVHSFSLTTFSPSGKLVQIEHALAAVGQGTLSLGIKGELSVYLAHEVGEDLEGEGTMRGITRRNHFSERSTW